MAFTAGPPRLPPTCIRVPRSFGQPHRNGVVGVSDDPPGETYWKVANGIRLTGMPSYTKILNETQMWQVSVLLANADKPLPPQVMESLKKPLESDIPPPAAGADLPATAPPAAH